MIDITSPTALAPYFSYRDSVVPAGSAAGKVVAPANANRVALILSSGSGAIQIRPYTPGNFAQNFSVQGSSQPLILRFADIGGVVGADWYIAATTATAMYVGEVIFYPPEE